MAYMHEPTDCALLRVLELDAPDDPLHFLGLKWALNKMPMQAIVTPRDTCYLDAMGVEKDGNGKKFGYIALESVDLPECPPFERDLPWHATPLASMSFINGMLQAVSCAEAKKLTLLARHNAVSGYNLDVINQDEEFGKDAVCSVCIKRSKTRLFSAVRLRACRVCGVAICSKCSAKNKRLFLGSERPCTFAVCCPNCVVEAQEMTDLQPCQEQYTVVADFYLHGRALESYSGALDAALAHQEHMSTLSVSEVEESAWWSEDNADTISIPDAVREKSPKERQTIDESWAGRDFMDGHATTLSDFNTVESGFCSSAEEEDDFSFEVGQVVPYERPYEEEITVNVNSTSDALAALLKRAAVIGSQVQQTDSAMRQLEQTRVQSRRLRLP
ncbi:hypothetical protein BBO99_00002655 [Phytophthora kernoviae]|uniref:FYVE-type domain-containing protein n=2 Tax=Phytophthora kernoviae TaxID=325452 RepID=A0A3R7GKZ1_9STRA|nr:hypothetical protein G195_004547 [Phytophthora kernoviae 00238/432]KAG2528430.1 hypothetical protein JM18_002629 [Phytophthora kernoviae]RLN14124.1 hypothetical protein BBI17_002599 [Phytophthora kernoviae]RLN82779.1 hypothetical protein BBO99_00002655 [Phytophthora kernoviae]